MYIDKQQLQSPKKESAKLQDFNSANKKHGATIVPLKLKRKKKKSSDRAQLPTSITTE